MNKLNIIVTFIFTIHAFFWQLNFYASQFLILILFRTGSVYLKEPEPWAISKFRFWKRFWCDTWLSAALFWSSDHSLFPVKDVTNRITETLPCLFNYWSHCFEWRALHRLAAMRSVPSTLTAEHNFSMTVCAMGVGLGGRR